MPEQLTLYLESALSSIVEITIAIALFSGLLLKRQINSYFEVKGKNLATKEDIGEITNIVEEVKSDLSFSLEGKLNWRKEQHSALVGSYSAISEWIEFLTSMMYLGINEKNFQSKIEQARLRNSELQHHASMALKRVELFVEDSEVITLSHNLFNGAMDIATVVLTTGIDISTKYEALLNWKDMINKSEFEEKVSKINTEVNTIINASDIKRIDISTNLQIMRSLPLRNKTSTLLKDLLTHRN